MKKTIVALAGLPASGKSAVATRLHTAFDSVLLDKDLVRDFLFQQHVDYSNAQNDLCIGIMYDVANYLLANDTVPFIIIDGRSYSRKSQIDTLKTFASKAHCQLKIIECICSAESAKRRLEHDQGVHPAKDRDYALYMRSKAAADPIEEPRLILDTDKFSADECARQALAYISDQAQGIEGRHKQTNAKDIIVLDIGGTHIRIGHWRNNEQCNDFNVLDTGVLRVENAHDALSDIIKQYARKLELDTKAIVIGIPGMLNQDTDTVTHCNNIPQLEGSGLQARLTDRLGCKVVLEQDIMLQLRGEWRTGAARHSPSVFGVYYGTGIGAAYLVDGKPKVHKLYGGVLNLDSALHVTYTLNLETGRGSCSMCSWCRAHSR